MVDAPQATQFVSDPDALVEEVLARVGNRIVLGLPLGLGKANHFANALYRRAADDADISLTILTALTLEAPAPGDDLSARFIKPLKERFFDQYPPLKYAQALRQNALPPNIRVHEFYLQAGAWLGNETMQQNYISLNYTEATDYLLEQGVNVIGQLIVPEEPSSESPTEYYSLSCNADVTPDLFALRAAGQLDCLVVGQVNSRLPFMGGDAKRPLSDFDFILSDPSLEFPLFTPPSEPVELTDHAIGLHVAGLIPDAGTLQIGIGSIGDAITNALVMRQRDNSRFREIASRLRADQSTPVYSDTFDEGLYGLSEMLVEGFLLLMETGVLKREVAGRLLEAAFFVGSPTFYRRLAAMPASQRDKIAMRPVSFTNSLLGDEQGKRQARQHARFVNSAMMVTLNGSAVSDSLANGQVVSGVGGQHDFIQQAFALEGARAILTLRATRTRKGKTESNIRWSYPQATIPRQYRDLVVTEYGVADLRNKSDADVIKQLLNISDSRFQPELQKQAVEAGKLPADYVIPPECRNNSPQRIEACLQKGLPPGTLPVFPLGSDLTPEEQRLALALSRLSRNRGAPLKLLSLAWQGLWRKTPASDQACLARMGLERAATPREWFLRLLLSVALADKD